MTKMNEQTKTTKQIQKRHYLSYSGILFLLSGAWQNHKVEFPISCGRQNIIIIVIK